MNKSITQSTQNDKQISKSIKRFFTRFHISSALKAANVLIIDDSMFERNRSTMPCLHFWKLLKKLQFQQNMFFLTAGFHLQFSRCIGTYSSAISLRK